MIHPKLIDRAQQKLFIVDDEGQRTGEIVERWKAHTAPGVRHLAVGILVYNKNNEIILHKRLNTKVGGNTIDYPVSHVLQGETIEEACWRCLKHEYGIEERLPLTELFGFPYNYNYDDGTCENEYLLVFKIVYGGNIIPNTSEMEKDLITTSLHALIEDGEKNPDKYSIWFLHTFLHLKKL